MADYSLLESSLNSLSGTFMGAANMAMSYGTHKRDRKFNAEQAELARQWQEKMWNSANEYNSPIQQMQRLTDAGLNPNLVYGNGADTTAASVPSTEKASYSGANTPRLDLFTGRLQAKQLELLEAQIANVESQTNLTDEKATTQNIVNQHEDERLSAIVKSLSLDADFQEFTFNNRRTINELELDNAKIDNYTKRLSSMYLPEQLELSLNRGYQELNNLVATNRLTWEQVKNVSTQTWFIGEQVKFVRASAIERLAAAGEHNAAAAEHYAGAALKNAQTLTENQLRDAKEYGLWASGYSSYGSGAMSFANADKINKLSDAELGKLVVDTNKAILEGNIDWLKMAHNRYGSGVVGSFLNTINQTMNSIGRDFSHGRISLDPMQDYRFNGYNP